MSNILAVRQLAASITVNHYFSNVGDLFSNDGNQELPPYEVFELFMDKINTSIDNGNGSRPAYSSFNHEEDETDPLLWAQFEDEWLETLVDYINATHNNVLRTAADVGLVTKDEILPFIL